MTCIECRSQSEDFAYCNVSMCRKPVCSKCAVIHALKETFQRFPLNDENKNNFYSKVKLDYLKLSNKTHQTKGITKYPRSDSQ